MHTWLPPLIGGLCGTAIMTLALLLPSWLGFGRVDVIRAVGALFIRLPQKAFLPGFIIHICSGIIFAYIYQIILGLSYIPLNALTGLMMGSLHGVIIMILVSIMIMEHHPIAYYHTRGPMTGFAQLLAHMLYGLVVGFIVQIMQ
ncbi:MAG: hypothetical protein A3F67_08750 [Verrucomicrobia bacterium RIFCSPHIGHO2_12_FULL_41_10]|nr:MAG: hypothetical protein A3F67_08750 [Verrucomicrobia bacterium RIFCSPHIGHO2_12_FULL_41_10]HLB33489.1 DUF6789 family protein [Chthoniobacterales bacterium]